ncbi:hypothetical protein SDC9_72159 [bioreactor metagenome]|uniref:Flagellar protein n=1 Tax=bioreactor metagenome TaxID=1076179 RepID=A0A644YCP5_9ZZZZ
MSFWNYVWAMVVICGVIFAAYYVTRAVAKTGGTLRKNANLKMVGSLPLARDKSVALVEIGEYIFVLGVSAQRVERLDKLPKSELSLAAENPVPMTQFAESFKEELNERWKKLRKKPDE